MVIVRVFLTLFIAVKLLETQWQMLRVTNCKDLRKKKKENNQEKGRYKVFAQCHNRDIMKKLVL